MAPKPSQEATPDISKLNISDKSKPKKKVAEVADSWEDDFDSSSEEEEAPPAPAKTEPEASAGAERDDGVLFDDPTNGYSDKPESSRSRVPDKRPEKTTLPLKRLIMGDLGKRYKSTDEEKAQHKMKLENEKKRKEEEKRKREEDAKAKESIWND